MGKLLKQQRRGKGSPAYIAQSHRYKAKIAFRKIDSIEKEGSLRGAVMKFVDDPAHQVILMHVRFANNDEIMVPAPEGIAVGDEVYSGALAPIKPGCIVPLSKLPEGMFIYNVERNVGDGGKFVRAPGAYATLVSKEKGKAYVKLPSRKVIELQATCRAQIGLLCGGGKLEMPLLKAGVNHYKKHAQNRKWPVNRGVKMNAYTHPYGGKQHHKGRSSTTSRGAPPGRKVGHIAAKSTGRKKSKNA
ncbi:50S ribosomal protein L2 [Candidatus Micrarchaeota archaeon CG10_big_fil_rev_8_21_14_0_10_45_29]|nr:MAG: 50S ribosomal protein L2 [Candidatus Micrarchaeota archaeon CG10_big_fil_rev_8_21_14_0_10_45_29]